MSTLSLREEKRKERIWQIVPPTWIFGTRRTGTSALASSMNKSKMFYPHVLEYFNADMHGLGNDKIIPKFPRNCKLFPYQWEEQFHGTREYAEIEDEYPDVKWIYTYRESIAAQVASFILASTSGVWNSVPRDEKQIEMYALVGIEVSDERIFEVRDALVREDNEVRAFLLHRDYLPISYEQFTDNMPGTINHIFNYLGFKAEFKKPNYIKLPNVRKEALVKHVEEVLNGNT